MNADQPKYGHYFKDVSHLKKIDVYRVIDLWQITNPALQHALKKVLAAGQRGAKDTVQDVQEAIDSLVRWKEMQDENGLAKPQTDVMHNSKAVKQTDKAKTAQTKQTT